ncbi:sensor histidine kinase [Streptomyces sp. JNUCC 64]
MPSAPPSPPVPPSGPSGPPGAALRAVRALARPAGRAVTYTRWLHLLLGWLFALVSAMIAPGLGGDMTVTEWLMVALFPMVPAALLGLVPVVRRAEGLQARLMLFPGSGARGAEAARVPAVSAAPSASWGERGRTSLWLMTRLAAGGLMALATSLAAAQLLVLVAVAAGASPDGIGPRFWAPARWWVAALFLPVPMAVLLGCVVVLGSAVAAAAVRLLGPSPAQRLAELEERAERLAERSRIAHELHDSIGHALSVAVVQAGAARAAGDPEFTRRALTAIEETGRAALEDLDRVLAVLREPRRPASARPGLDEAERLLGAARASGAVVDARVSGPVERLPGPVSRECYRMLQESLTNVLRHAGPVPVRIRIRVSGARVDLEVRNPLPPDPVGGAGPDRGGGLRGIRERAALLGGLADTGPVGGEWRVRARLPLGGPSEAPGTGGLSWADAPDGPPRR